MRRKRLLLTMALALGLLFTLSGCVKLDMDLTIRSNDTVDGTVVLAVDKSLLEVAGQGEQALRDQLETQGPFPASDRPTRGNFSQHPYDKDGKIGEAYVFSGVPLAEFGKGSSTGLSITHRGDRYFVTGQLDLSRDSAIGQQGQLAKQAGASADVRIRLTFPGEVLKSNGKIDGRSVTWHPKLGEKTALTAEARTTAVIPKLLAITGGVVGLLIVIGVVALLLALRRRQAPSSYVQQPLGYPPPGYGPPYPPQHGGYDAPYPQQPAGYGGPPPSQPGGYGGSPSTDQTVPLPLPTVDPTRPVPPDEGSGQR